MVNLYLVFMQMFCFCLFLAKFTANVNKLREHSHQIAIIRGKKERVEAYSRTFAKQTQMAINSVNAVYL